MKGLRRGAWVGLALSLVTTIGCWVAKPVMEPRLRIDFEQFAAGQILSEIQMPSGRVVRVHGENPGYKPNGAVIFDSAHWSGDDHDLATPHRDFEIVLEDGTRVPGPGIGRGGRSGSLCQNDTPLGKILIVDEDLLPLTDDGRVAEPDDEGQIGAKLFLDFTDYGSVTVHDITFIDVEEVPGEVVFFKVGYDDEQKRTQQRHRLATYRFRTLDNGVVRLFREELRTAPEEGCYVRLESRRHGKVLTPIAGVRLLEVDFAGSGAIDNIDFAPERPRKGLSSP